MSVNEELKAQGLLREKLFTVGKTVCASLAAEATLSPDSEFQMPQLRELVGSAPAEEAGFLYRLAQDADLRSQVLRDRSLGASSALGDWLAPRPADYREATLRRLFQTGYFGKRTEDLVIGDGRAVPRRSRSRARVRVYDPRLEAVAYFMIRSLSSKACVEIYLPGLDYAEFHRLQSVVNRAVDQFIPKKMRKFQAFLADPKLKKQHKAAFVAAYLDNPDRLSQREIARRDKMPLGTLQARIKAAKEILRKHFSEWKTPRPALASKTSLFRKSGTRARFWRKRRAPGDTTRPVHRIHPVTGERLAPVPYWTRSYSQSSKTPQKNFEKNAALYEQSWYEPQADAQWALPGRRSRIEYPRRRRL